MSGKIEGGHLLADDPASLVKTEPGVVGVKAVRVPKPTKPRPSVGHLRHEDAVVLEYMNGADGWPWEWEQVEDFLAYLNAAIDGAPATKNTPFPPGQRKRWAELSTEELARIEFVWDTLHDWVVDRYGQSTWAKLPGPKFKTRNGAMKGIASRFAARATFEELHNGEQMAAEVWGYKAE